MMGDTEAARDIPESSPARKKPRTTAEPAPARSLDPLQSIGLFQRRGYVVIPSFLTAEELAFLHDESTQLFAALDKDVAVATQMLVDSGCVLDTMADCPMQEASPARVDKRAYLEARAHQVGRLGGALATTYDGTQTLDLLLFERLPRLALQLLDVDPTEPVYFFNEHYVVKPPRTNVEFRWHRDDDEQLAMCVHRDTIPPYVSAWCALDDVTLENGPLQFVPLDTGTSLSLDPTIQELRDAASEPLVVTAGTAVMFLSNVWHFSSSNRSAATRRAFYAQYSATPITATPRKEDAPLSFAVPCQFKT